MRGVECEWPGGGDDDDDDDDKTKTDEGEGGCRCVEASIRARATIPTGPLVPSPGPALVCSASAVVVKPC